ncbi:MAG: trypsin-like peptidase domain-containing protein [Patescibacteria group bacterium]
MPKNRNVLTGVIYTLVFVFFLWFLIGKSSSTNPLKDMVSSVKSSVKSILNFGKADKRDSVVLKQSVVEEESAIIGVVDQVSPAVVSIVEKSVDFDPFSGPVSSEQGIGTGFIVKTNGLVVTNSHVVSDTSSEYSVVLKDGKSFDVKKIHRDPVDDLALLELNASDLPTVDLGDSSNLKVGQKAIAIGNALGQFSNTVTVGVISGVSRQVTASSSPFGGDTKAYNDVIQTDAALNPGNSGGPLLNLYGQVVGVNVATTRGAENIGFAIPSSHVVPVLKTFEEKGRIIRPFLGVNFSLITKDIAALRRFPEGAFISRVGVDTPADKAGLQRGDIIIEMDGSKINDKNPLDVEIQQKHQVGDKVNLKIDRKGEILSLDATLGEAPQE